MPPGEFGAGPAAQDGYEDEKEKEKETL